jgi:hypothetical protein
MERHKSAAWLYGFLAAVDRGDHYAPPHVVEMVERVLARYERTWATGGGGSWRGNADRARKQSRHDLPEQLPRRAAAAVWPEALKGRRPEL